MSSVFWKRNWYLVLVAGLTSFGCALTFSTPSSEPATSTPQPIVLTEAVKVTDSSPTVVPTAFQMPTALPLQSGTALPPTAIPETLAPTEPPAATLTQVPADTPPKQGSFDVYLGAPDPQGNQLLRWVDSRSGEKITEISIRADDQSAVRAGQYVYFYAAGTRDPQRVNTAGAIQPLTFAAPTPGAKSYQFLPSATGNYIAWVTVLPDSQYRIHLSGADGIYADQIGGDTLLPGETIKLLRVSNDGQRVFYERRPASVTHQPLLGGKYDIYLLDTRSNQVLHLPGEPACGEALICDAHVSADGAFLIRTLPIGSAPEPVIVTNLVTSVVAARFAPPQTPSGFTLEVGFPFLTPGGELIYEQAYGPPQLENYRFIWANIVTGEQRVVVELGHDKHRPLGWAADGINLLTTREPNYDTWQINVETGAIRQIAGMLFLGHIQEPPLNP